MSDDGQYWIIGSWDNAFIVSNDYGMTFTHGIPSNSQVQIDPVTCSSTGQYMAALDSVYHTGIYVSTNYGVTFTLKAASESWISNAKGLSFSGDGSLLYVSDTGYGYNYLSRNQGNTWNQSGWVNNWSGVLKVSGDGHTIVVTDSSQDVYIGKA